MADIEIYTIAWCPYCDRARALLQKKGVPFTEHDAPTNSEARKQAIQRSGGKTTVPQIFIDGRSIGGCDDLVKLDRTGQLDPLLAA